MMTTKRNRLTEKSWLEFGKKLLPEEGISAQNELPQEEFLEVCQSGKDDFMKYIHEHLLSHGNRILDGGLVDLEYKFTESEFVHPPKTTQKIIWDVFRSEPDERLYSCGCWGYVVIRMIEANCIEPCYLAVDWDGASETGAFVLDNAIANPDAKMDDCVRRVLRSMCNPAPRGKRIVFNDFHIGKSYWRWHWAHRMSQHISLSVDQILEVLDEKYYAEFSAKMHSSKSYVGSKNTLGGLLLFLAQEQKAQREITGKQLREIIDNIDSMSAWKAIEMQDPQTNKKEIEQIARGL